MAAINTLRYEAWVGLGASLGDRLETLGSACRSLARLGPQLIELRACSSVYATTPVGPARSEFFNAALRLRSSLVPSELMDLLLRIEALHGRTREIHWGDRSLDLDLLMVRELQGNQPLHWIESQTAQLLLPHPRIWERDFVLVPLGELNPNLCLRGRPLRQWCERLDPALSTLRRRVAGPGALMSAASPLSWQGASVEA